MANDPKKFMAERRSPVGIVETEGGCQIARFKDATGMGCWVAQAKVKTELGQDALSLGMDSGSMMLDPEMAMRLGNALRYWAQNHTLISK